MKLLHIEDDHLDALLTARESHHDITHVLDVESARVEVSRCTFDAILIDLCLVRTRGRDTVAEVRGFWAGPLVALTSHPIALDIPIVQKGDAEDLDRVLQEACLHE